MAIREVFGVFFSLRYQSNKYNTERLVVCITFYQTNLFDDVYTVLEVLPAASYASYLFLGTPLIYWNTDDLVL